MQTLAKKIIELVGGESNILNCTHCATRLRLRLNDTSIAKTEQIKKLKEVITVVDSGGQYQIVVGDIVNDLFDAVTSQLNGKKGNIASNESKQKEKLSKRFMSKLLDLTTSIFSPTIPALVAGGIVKGILALLVALNLMNTASGTYIILYSAANAIFYFYPVLLGYTSGKRFGINPFVGMAIGAALVYPDIISTAGSEPLYSLFEGTVFESNVKMEFLGIPVILMNYSTSVLPIIVTNYFAGIVHKIFDKVLPILIKKVLLPSITLVMAVPLGLLVIGPIVTFGCNIVGDMIMGLFEFNTVITSALLGFLWQPLVMLGLHKGLLPIAINNFSVYGYDYIYPVSSIAAYATAGALLAIFVKSKKKNTKDLSLASFFQAVIASITEPAIYGVTIPLWKPFIAANIASALGGVVLGLFDTKCYFMSTGSFFGLGSYIEPNGTFGSSFYGILAAWATVIVAGFVITYIMGFDESRIPSEEDDVNSNTITSKEEHTMSVGMPVKGQMIDLSNVNDQVFSSNSLGRGFAIQPQEGKLYAPFDGKIQFVFETGHAVGLVSNSGIELLIHIGVDSAELKDLFKVYIEKNQEVKKGDLLIEFDLEELKKEAKDSAVIVIVTNADKYLDIVPNNSESLALFDDALYVIEGGVC